MKKEVEGRSRHRDRGWIVEKEEEEEEEEEEEGGLVRLCIEAASQSKECIEKWRRQRRTLEKMPIPLAEALLHRLLRRRLLSPSLLEVFQHSIERINLRGKKFVDAEWMAYLGAFRCLHTLDVADCRVINDSALWAITGMDSLKELDLSRCIKISDAGIVHLLSIPKLEKLRLSETGLTTHGVVLLSSLRKLSVLDLGGLPVTDSALSALKVLTDLEDLDLWGSKISNHATTSLKVFLKLRILNLAWTEVTEVPYLPSLTCLNMSNCTIHSLFKKGYDENKAPSLAKLYLAGTILTDVHEAFSYIEPSALTFIDLSNSSLNGFWYLASTTALEHLDLSFSRIDDDSIEGIICVGATLKFLNLSHTRVSSTGIGILAGRVPKVETLLLSHTAIDDVALSYISLMPSLRMLDLSNTNIQGFQYLEGNRSDLVLSLTTLQRLNNLERLSLEETQIRTEALHPLSSLQALKILSLKSDFLTDVSLSILSSLLNLKFLGIRGAVLTNTGLQSFDPPPKLEVLDLRDCWLLTSDAISSFCQFHPHIKIQHEYAQNSTAPRYSDAQAPAANGTSETLHGKPKKGKAALAQCIFGEKGFVDERIKYSIQELLELQFSSLSCESSHGSGSTSQQKPAELFCSLEDANNPFSDRIN